MDYTASTTGTAAGALTDEELREWALAMRISRLASVIESLRTEAAMAAGFSVAGDYQLAALVDRAGPLSPSQVAEELRLTRAGVTGRLHRLRAGGLIAENDDTSDGRRKLVALTPKARKAARAARRGAIDRYSGLFAPLEPSEREQLSALLQRILTEPDPPTAG